MLIVKFLFGLTTNQEFTFILGLTIRMDILLEKFDIKQNIGTELII